MIEKKKKGRTPAEVEEEGDEDLSLVEHCQILVEQYNKEINNYEKAVNKLEEGTEDELKSKGTKPHTTMTPLQSSQTQKKRNLQEKNSKKPPSNDPSKHFPT